MVSVNGLHSLKQPASRINKQIKLAFKTYKTALQGSETVTFNKRAIVFLPLFWTPIAILPLLFLTLHFYPYCSQMNTHSTPTPWTAVNGVKEDNFTLANIPLLFLELCEYTSVFIIFQQNFNKNMNKYLTEIWTATWHTKLSWNHMHICW